MSARIAEFFASDGRTRRRVRRRIVALVQFLQITPLFAGVYLSPCTLEKDPLHSTSLFSLCLEGNAGTWIEHRSKVDDDIQPPQIFASQGKATLLLGSFFTLQASGHAYLWRPRFDDKPQNDVILKQNPKKEYESESVIAQVGNTALFRHRVFGGKGSIPFGLNMDVNSMWQGSQTRKKFYGDDLLIGGYTYDNQLDLMITVAAGVEDADANDKAERRGVGGVRIAYDLAMLEGTRLLASATSDESAHKRASFGVLNVNGKGDVAGFEIVRSWQNYPYDPNEFDQLIRLSLRGSFQDSIQPLFQYEDESQLRRIGTLGARMSLHKHALISLLVGYCRTEFDTSRNYWFGVFGTEVQL